MMNQYANTETIAEVEVETNSFENRQVVDASQLHTSSYQPSTSSYVPSTNVPEAISWASNRLDSGTTDNGVLSNSTYQYNLSTQQPGRNSQDGLNVAPVAGTSSSFGTSNASQDYNCYSSYTNSNDPYGYGSTAYHGYYNNYQQQPNHSYSQPVGAYQNTGVPQPVGSFQNTEAPQPVGSYQNTGGPQPLGSYQNAGDPQPVGSYQNGGAQPVGSYQNSGAPQPVGSYQNTGAPQPVGSYQNAVPPQPVGSYHNTVPPQPVGSYQNTGATHQPLTSFQNTGSYAGSASYSTTYYNPGDYQTAGGYPSTGYINQTTSWSDGNYSNYASNQYQHYANNSIGAYNTGSAAATTQQYAQHYKQWNDYYNQSEVSCAPGTENLAVSSATNVECPPPGVTSSYPTSNSLPPPPPYAPSWRPEANSSELPHMQPGAVSNHDCYWKHGAVNSQVHLNNATQPHFQNPLDLKSSYDSFQGQQQNSYPQGTNLQYPSAHQVPQSYQPGSQTAQSLDTRRVSKLQIPTNPRIASNLTMCLPKTDKDSFVTSAAAKPAYISVSLPPKSNDKELPKDTADYLLKPGIFPKSLRGYVERALARCEDDKQMAACQSVMKEMLTKATADGTLYTRDWDTEPLFPLPNVDVMNKSLQHSAPHSLLPKRRSPGRRSKSRWEPIPEDKSAEPIAPVSNDTPKYGSWMHVQGKERKPLMENSESKGNNFSNSRFSLWDQKKFSNIAQQPFKKQRSVENVNASDNGDSSSDSDKEQSLTAYYSGAIALANSSEEKKRRESRSKRFEKVNGNRVANSHLKPKNFGAGSLYTTRRASAMVLSKSFEDGGSRAVEDIDWDALTVKGTCQEIEKRYLRLTSAPDPASVRPEEVLEKALLMVQNSQKNYLYKCDQLKSIRQDLTVQRICNKLTVKVYETHARFALEVGDLPEYNQCQSQLKTLYAEGIEGCHMEFAAYNLLCVIMHSNNYRDLLSSMSRLSIEAKKDEAVKHALAVRAAVTSGNYVMFFRLYKSAPNLNTCLMDLYVEKMRYKAVNCMSRSYRPTVPVSYVAQVLGFTSALHNNEEKDSDGLEECMEWLKAHGASLVADNNGEMQLHTKVSSSSLFMPEPEDAVAHGDANLAVNDFFTRTPV